MTMAINKIKWFAVSISVLSLLMVVWVWPAWNSGSQNWYLGNDSGSRALIPPIPTNPMYRNERPKAPYNDDFVFLYDLTQNFMANEAAMTMFTFGTDPWQYHIEWYRDDGGMMVMMVRGIMGNLDYHLEIGRWRNSMFAPFFTVSGSSAGDGTMALRNVIRDSGSTMTTMSLLSFKRGDVLGAMLTLMNTSMSMGGNYHVFLKNTSSITSPLSDPGYPGGDPIPTLSQWGMLFFAAILAVLSVSVIRRRVRVGRN